MLPRWLHKIVKPHEPFGPWMLTFSGRQFYVADPQLESIVIEDVAHSLSNLCRFAGAVKTFYSVAQHSLSVEEEVERIIGKDDWTVDVRLKSLIHDVGEVFCSDVPRPVRKLVPKFNRIENRIWKAVCQKYDLEPKWEDVITDADDTVLLAERRAFLCRPVTIGWNRINTKPAQKK